MKKCQGDSLETKHAIYRTNRTNWSVVVYPHRTCEMGREDSGISALGRQRWPRTSLNVVCNNGFVGTEKCSSRSAGRLEEWIISFPFQNWCAWDAMTVRFLIWVSIGCQVGALLFAPVRQVDSIWIIIRSKRPSVFHPHWANLTSDLRGGSSRQPSPRYSAITFLTAFHISDGWSVCRQAALTRRSKEAPGDALPDAAGGPDGKRREISQGLACFWRYSSIRHSHAWLHTHTYTCLTSFKLTDPADFWNSYEISHLQSRLQDNKF